MATFAEDPDFVKEVAEEIYLLPYRMGFVKRAKRAEAATFLKTYEVYLGVERCKRAVAFVRTLTREQVKSPFPIGAAVVSTEYRSLEGAAAFYPRGCLRKAPSDDLSERIWEAYLSLKESRCPNASTFIAAELGEGWSRERVESRVKTFKTRKQPPWPGNRWRLRYWHQLPGNMDEPIPETFEFAPFTGADGKP
jgi:hypothetical protein